jgi:hypothetical protein
MTLVDDRGRSGIESIDVIEMKAQQKAMVLPQAAAKGFAEFLRRTSRSEVKHFADDYFLQTRAFIGNGRQRTTPTGQRRFGAVD